MEIIKHEYEHKSYTLKTKKIDKIILHCSATREG